MPSSTPPSAILKASLDKLQIANQEQKELLAVMEAARTQIVTER